MKYFYSDPHFFHKRIMEFYPSSRPFETIEEMHTEMIKRFNEVVSGGAEVVYHLGDFALIKHDLSNLNEGKEILSLLNGEKHILIRGNHDKYGVEQLGFDEIYDQLRIRLIDGTEIILNHYRIENNNDIVLHGHDHHGSIIQNMNINLNCELNHLYPYSEKQVIDLIKTK